MTNKPKVLILIISFLSGICCSLDDELTRQEENPFRLPGDIRPVHYNISLIPILDGDNFTTLGQIEITLDCIRDTTQIKLNSVDIEIDEGSILVVDNMEGGGNLAANLVDQNNIIETITIQVGGRPGLLAGKQYKLSMSFVSILNDELRGLYRSSYVDENGDTKYIAVTQMAGPDARRAFPCFDEPAMKATFSLRVGRNNSSTYHTLSNTPIRQTQPNLELPDYVWDEYEPTPKMPSYLVALMVSDFVNVTSDPELSPSVEFNVWTRPGYENQTSYAGYVGPRLLNHFSKDYLGIDYPIPKLDMVAVPDFAAGAMENWGLINYREADLLIDERSSQVAKKRVAAVIAHEIAHQWFGNLVTHEWWNVVWLKEGFARYMQHLGADIVEPTFRMEDQFVIDVLQYVFGLDALESSRPINHPATSRAGINQNYDAITYEKGACLVRMVAHLIGKETYRKGIIRYLNTKAYGNAVQDDLWGALQAQVDEDGSSIPLSVKAIMDTWTNKMGYPVVTVTRNYQTGQALVEQERFLLSKSETPSNDITNYRWHIPLTYTSNFLQKQQLNWLPVNLDNVTISLLGGASNTQWVIFNVDQAAYYRVKYDDTNLGLIRNQLMRDNHVIPVINRAQIYDDYFNLARANMTSYANALGLTKALVHEKDYVPWAAASTALDYVNMMLYNVSEIDEWKTYMSGPVSKLYEHVGFFQGENDSHLQIYARSVALNWACGKLAIPDCVENAVDLYSAWMEDPSNNSLVSPNLRLVISCTAVAKGSTLEWGFAYAKYLGSNLGNEKIDFLLAMACSTDPEIIAATLELMINATSGIRTQDANRLFTSIANSAAGHPIAMEFVAERWDDIDDYFKGYSGFGGNGNLPGFFKALCTRVNTDEQLEKLEQLVRDHPDQLEGLKSVEQGLELAKSNIRWVADFSSEIIDWVKAENEASAVSPSQPTTTRTPTTASSSILTANLALLVLLAFFPIILFIISLT